MNVLKDYFEYQGEQGISGSRDAIRLAFKRGVIDDGGSWMDMISSRVKSSYTYNQETAEKTVGKIENVYYELFFQFSQKFKTLL